LSGVWVVEYLAIDEFQQPKFWRRLFKFFDDLRVLVGFNALSVISQFIGDLPLFEMMDEGGQLGDQLIPKVRFVSGLHLLN
jgi:hypothetical protein